MGQNIDLHDENSRSYRHKKFEIMNDSTQLSESQIKAIEREAEKAAEIAWEHLKGKNDSSPLVWVAGYTEGLTAERIKSKKQAIEFHDWFMKINKMGSETRKRVYEKYDHTPTTEDFYNYWVSQYNNKTV